MKVEPRGKYAGVKLHLDENEVKQLLDAQVHGAKAAQSLVQEMATSVSSALAKNPDMLKARTQAQIIKALKRDQKKISEQLAAIDGGKDWKTVE